MLYPLLADGEVELDEGAEEDVDAEAHLLTSFHQLFSKKEWLRKLH